MDLKKYPRAGGLVLFAFGMSVSGWFYNRTIDGAIKEAPKVIWLPHAFGALIVMAFVGLGMMIFGEKVQAYSKGLRGRKKNIKDFVIIGLFVLPGIIAGAYLQFKLGQLGYR
jgi:hypothetical protein